MNSRSRQFTYIWFLASFLLPPGLWLTMCWHSGLFSVSELLAIAASPLLGAYVIGFVGIATFLFHRSLRKIGQYMENPGAGDLAATQRRIALVPVFILASQFTYNAIGPNTGLYGHDFVDSTEWGLAWALGFTLILAYAVPFLVLMVDQSGTLDGRGTSRQGTSRTRNHGTSDDGGSWGLDRRVHDDLRVFPDRGLQDTKH